VAPFPRYSQFRTTRNDQRLKQFKNDKNFLSLFLPFSLLFLLSRLKTLTKIVYAAIKNNFLILVKLARFLTNHRLSLVAGMVARGVRACGWRIDIKEID